MEQDERFKHISTDPKFRHIPKKLSKVKIDKRFRGMFNDEKFKVTYTVDKRGRPVNHSSTNDLKRYYDISESDSSDSDTDEVGKFVKAPKSDSTNELTVEHEDDKPVSNDVKNKLKNLNVDYARGEAYLNSESSSDEETEEDEQESDIEHGWGELDKDAEKTDEITHRLAICNMDWDRIRAIDLMVLFNSFLPVGGLIKSITIYPSEYGLQRMQEEELKGPIELVENNDKSKYNDEENEEGSKYHMEKLRQYQLNRLKYYYGVLVFDSPETANKIYTECDGLEYESSATKVDLRFIPNDTIFDQKPKEVCDKLPEMSKYQPRFFTTTALQQAKVELTWDETNPKRLEIAKKLSGGKVDDVTEADLQDYLASSSGEEDDTEIRDEPVVESDEENDNPINKYRALLADLEKTDQKKKNSDIEMEVSWGLNVKENTEKLVKKKLEENEEKTPFQKYLDKRKEKRKIKRENKKSNKTSDNEDENDEIDSDMDLDMNDPYFAEEFDNSEFKINKKQKTKKKTSESDEISKEEQTQLELLLLDNDDGRKHFNLKELEKQQNYNEKKKKRKNKKEKDSSETKDDFEVNVKDARFSAIFNSHHFNIDPTDSQFRKTKGMEALVEEKQKRIHQNDNDSQHLPPNKKSKNSELNALVNSVKRKTKNFINKK